MVKSEKDRNMKKQIITTFILLFCACMISLAQNHKKPTSIKKATVKAEKQVKKERMKAYKRKLLQVSPRVQFGIGNYFSTMTYETPNLGAEITHLTNDLKADFPWVPWKNVSIEQGPSTRTRTMQKNGEFYGIVGMNLPGIFVDMEIGPGRFSRASFSAGDLFGEGNLAETVAGQIIAPETKRSFTMKIGADVGRVLPDHLLPELDFGPVDVGIDGSAYYLMGVDFSYRVGTEIIDPSATEHLEEIFEPVPIISDRAKKEAAETIIGHIESNLPTYFWAPAFKGYGYSIKAYIDIGERLRITGGYNFERAKGMSFEDADWLQAGPIVKRRFYSFGISTQI